MLLHIRQACMEDLEILVTFNRALAKETEQRDLDGHRLRLGVEALLQDPRKGWYVVAESQASPNKGQVIAQLLITFEWSDWRNGMFWWIQSLYVEPHHRRQGIFRQLFQYVNTQAQASQSPVCGVRLYVEQENDQAHRAYECLGFRKSPYHMYEFEVS